MLVVGASQSLGRQIAIDCAQSAAAVIVCSRPRATPPGFVKAMRERGRPLYWIPGDMQDPESLAQVVGQVVRDHGRLDVLVVSGAPSGSGAGLFGTLEYEQYLGTLKAQFVSRLNCLRAALAPMKAQHYGKVVFITSDAGRTPTPGETLIGSAAAALMFFTRAAGKELARDGIRVNCIATTLVTGTPAYERSRRGELDRTLGKAFAKIAERTPFRLCTPADIARLAVFLASPGTDQISGATVSVNGGLSFP